MLHGTLGFHAERDAKIAIGTRETIYADLGITSPPEKLCCSRNFGLLVFGFGYGILNISRVITFRKFHLAAGAE